MFPYDILTYINRCGLRVTPEKACTQIVAMAVLHNMAVEFGDIEASFVLQYTSR